MEYEHTDKGTVIGVGTTINTARETGYQVVQRIGRKRTVIVRNSSKDTAFQLYMNAKNALTQDMLDGKYKRATLTVDKIRKVGTFEGTVSDPKISYYAEDVSFVKGIHFENVDGQVIRSKLG